MPICSSRANEGGKIKKNSWDFSCHDHAPPKDGDIDWIGLENLMEWYISLGAQELSAVC